MHTLQRNKAGELLVKNDLHNPKMFPIFELQ